MKKNGQTSAFHLENDVDRIRGNVDEMLTETKTCNVDETSIKTINLRDSSITEADVNKSCWNE